MPTRDAEILRQLLEVAHSGLLIIDQTGKVVFANPAARSILGWRRNKTRYLFQPNEGKLLDLHDASIPLKSNPVQQALSRQKPLTNVQFTWKRHSGRERQLSLSLVPILKDNNWQGAVVSIQDISLRVGEEHWREHLIRVAGHELRNPLASIMALTETLELLNDPEDGDRRGEYLEKIKQKIRSTSRLLNDFLDATRLSAGYLKYRDEINDLDPFIYRLIEDFQLSTPTHWIAIEGETNSQVRFDPIRITQVMDNLLSNAIKNSPAGTGITVQLSKQKNRAYIEVIDQGVGIPKHELNNIFRMYYRVQTGDRQPKGMGLGLYLVKQILSHYKSRIKINSQEGEGTSVIFSLPIQA